MYKLEYLIQEKPDSYGFDVMVCENDHIIAKRSFTSLRELVIDSARFNKNNPKARIAVEYRSGKVEELAP